MSGMTAADVKKAYADANGQEAANEVEDRIFEATAAYGRMLEIEAAGTTEFPYMDGRVATALDVLRLTDSKEFEAYGF